ncbi:MAG: ABC transporter ATP-binding protein [Bacteroidia bacterium]|nr:ABC transporter ATP-binding protein [Bacteroidia bacterium]
MARSTNNLASIRYAFRTIIWPRRRMLALGLLLVLINRASGLILPGSSQYLLDTVVPARDLDLLWKLLLVVGASVAVQAVTSFYLVRILSVEGQWMIAELRSKVQAHVMRLPVRFFDNTKSGNLVSRIMNDVEGVRNLVGTGFTQLIGGVATAVASLVILLSISPLLTIFSLVPMGIFGFVSLNAFGRIRPIFRDRGKIQAEVTGRLTESMSGIRVIKGFNAEQQEVDIFRKGAIRLYENIKSSLTTTSFVTSLGGLLAGLTTVGIMGIGGPMIMREALTQGELISFIFYLAFLIFPIVQMSNIGSQITEAFAGLDRTEELLRTPVETQDERRTASLPEIQGHITFRSVHFAYDEGKEVLHDISFDAPAGSITALVGSSGSGKTTIAGLAASFLNPSQGLITLDGTDLSTVILDSYRSRLGVVLQDDFLFEGTIRENILFPRPHATEAQLRAAVEAAYVHEFADRFEQGLDTVIGERGVKLSGGQRQRIAIARAILADPRVLILDEATSHLDTESESYIQKSLANLLEGRTTFVIAHRLSTIRRADQILVIEQGRIAERGTHDELIASQGRYYELYTYQSRI